MWVLDYIDDLRVDLSRFFPQLPLARDLLVDFDVLPANTFFTLATRLSAYGGVLASRMTELGAETAVSSRTNTSPEAMPGAARPHATENPTSPSGPAHGLDENGIRLPKDPKGGEVRVISLAQMAAENPDLIGLTKVG